MAITGSIANILGGRTVLKRKVASAGDLEETTREGLPYASLESLQNRLKLGRGEASAVLHLPARTIARRKKQRRFRPDESDRLVRLARVAAHAASVFGADETAADWLKRPNRALGGRSPLSLLDTDIGVRQVEDVLGRIEYGVIS